MPVVLRNTTTQRVYKIVLMVEVRDEDGAPTGEMDISLQGPNGGVFTERLTKPKMIALGYKVEQSE